MERRSAKSAGKTKGRARGGQQNSVESRGRAGLVGSSQHSALVESSRIVTVSGLRASGLNAEQSRAVGALLRWAAGSEPADIASISTRPHAGPSEALSVQTSTGSTSRILSSKPRRQPVQLASIPLTSVKVEVGTRTRSVKVASPAKSNDRFLRPQRMRLPPLAAWKNERVAYKREKGSPLPVPDKVILDVSSGGSGAGMNPVNVEVKNAVQLRANAGAQTLAAPGVMVVQRGPVKVHTGDCVREANAGDWLINPSSCTFTIECGRPKGSVSVIHQGL